MVIVIILLVPFLSKRDTYYKNGYIEKIEPVNDLRGCGNAIIYIKNYSGMSKILYTNNVEEISKLNNYDKLDYKI